MLMKEQTVSTTLTKIMVMSFLIDWRIELCGGLNWFAIYFKSICVRTQAFDLCQKRS